ncbi:MAG: hypothetical protein BWY26_00756 [Elusimicrobia bacterium ADurb.Bin231]|nr:MAG: hypothetical protein BWY26_00756 [Elusimicrobia bacterium ADurb.Bin231]
MNCKQTEKEMYFYVTGGLIASEKENVEKHLNVCKKCSDTVISFRKTIKSIDTVSKKLFIPPNRDRDYIVDSVMDRVNTTIKRRLFYPVYALAMFAIAFIFGSFYLFKSGAKQTGIAQLRLEEEQFVAFLTDFDIPEVYK